MTNYLFPEGTITFNDEIIAIIQDVTVEFEVKDILDPSHSQTRVTILARAIFVREWPLPEHFQIEVTHTKITITLYKCSVIKLYDPDIGGNHRFLAVPDPERNNVWGTITENESCL